MIFQRYFQLFRNAILIAGMLLVFQVGKTQSFTSSGGNINTDSTITTFNIAVTGLSALTTTYGLKKLSININHPAVEELHIYLRSNNTYSVPISIKNGRGANYSNTEFENSASQSITTGAAPFIGTYRPEGSMAVFNTNNITPNGNWAILILDDKKNNYNGSVTSITLEFGSNPATPINFKQSNLPVFVINTGGKTIPVLNDVLTKMYILNSNSGVNLLSDTQNVAAIDAGIHIRGNSSAAGLKDPFSFSPKAKNGSDSNMSILGMPAENDWILNNSYSDQSFMKDVLIYYLSNRMGRYASRTRYCELVIDGNYRGIYCLMEKIKQDNNRVNISSLKATDTSGANVTGGYILKRDGTPGVKDSGFMNAQSSIFFLYDDPDSPVIQQKTYIKAFIDSCVTALNSKPLNDTINGYRRFIDYKSAIDYIILNEFGVSGDTYARSTYWHKHKITKGNKLVFGPVWDFNYGFNSPTNSFKFLTFAPFKKMYDDTFFKKEFWCRYNEVRATLLNPIMVAHIIDSFTAPLADAMFRNDERWAQTKSGNQVIQNVYYKDAGYYLKKYTGERLRYLDSVFISGCAYMPSTCAPTLSYTLSKNNICSGDTTILSINTTSNDVILVTSANYWKQNKTSFVLRPTTGNNSYKIVWGKCSSYDTTTVVVTLSTPTTLQITGKDSIIAGDSVLLVVTGASTYFWNNVVRNINQTFDSVIVKPLNTFTYIATGNNGSYCDGSVSKKITVIPRVNLSMQLSADSLCAGEYFKAKGTGSNQLHWLVNGNLFNGDSIAFFTNTTLNIKMYGLTNFGVTDTIYRTVKVFPKPIFSLPSIATICEGDSFKINLNPANGYLWNPSSSAYQTANSTALFPNTSTKFTVLVISANGCVDSGSIQINVIPKPTLQLKASIPALCNGGSSILTATSNGTVTWLPDVTAQVLSPGEIEVTPTQTHTYYARAILNGCIVIDSITIIFQTKAHVSVNAYGGVCFGDSATITCYGAPFYNIIPSNGVRKASNNVFRCYLTSNTNYLIIGGSGSCADTVSSFIKAFQKTQMIVQPLAPIYNGNTPVMIRVIGGVTYDWLPHQGLDRYDNDTVYASPFTATNYTINAMDINQCPTTSEVLVSVIVGIKENTEGAFINVSPNPFQNELRITMGQGETAEVLMYNAIGEKLNEFQIHLGETIIPTQEWVSGIYFMRIGNRVWKLTKL